MHPKAKTHSKDVITCNVLEECMLSMANWTLGMQTHVLFFLPTPTFSSYEQNQTLQSETHEANAYAK